MTDAHGKPVESGSGTLLVQRPGKFRWDYQPRAEAPSGPSSRPVAPAAARRRRATDAQRGQLLVADGKNLWFYDRELAQVSVKPVEAALSATPVMLLSGSSAQLHDSFEISAAGSHDGLDWVRVQAAQRRGGFQSRRARLSRTISSLRMVVNDRLGQTVQLDFSHSERNARVDVRGAAVQAAGRVDVIGTPQS